MSVLDVCERGNCNPHTCPVCAQTCDACGHWLHECECPTLPIDTEDQP